MSWEPRPGICGDATTISVEGVGIELHCDRPLGSRGIAHRRQHHAALTATDGAAVDIWWTR